MILSTILTVFLIWVLLSYLKRHHSHYSSLKQLPGPVNLPIIGNLYLFIGVPRLDLQREFGKLLNKYRSIFCFWNGSQPEVHLAKAEYVELILSNSEHIEKGTGYRLLHPWLGQGLLTSGGSKWHHHRKLLTPAFHFKILENSMDTFVNRSKVLVSILEQQVDQVFNIYPYLTHCALDIICETAMGVEINAISNSNNQYVDTITRINEIISIRSINPFLQYDWIFNMHPLGKEFKKCVHFLHSFSAKVIENRKILYNKKKTGIIDDYGIKTKQSFLDTLIEASQADNCLSDVEIREEVDTFMFEGHDTVSAAMTWTLYYLGNRPEIQDQVYEELQEVLRDKKTPTSISDLNNLKYLECVIKESLRLCPSVPIVMRTLSNQIQIGKYKLPKGIPVGINIYGVHTDPDHYPDPNVFNPDRFLPENSKNRHPYAYIPFSAGPRNCIGQKFAMYEEKTILASILKNYKITSLVNDDNVEVLVEVILKPYGGLTVHMEKRIPNSMT